MNYELSKSQEIHRGPHHSEIWSQRESERDRQIDTHIMYRETPIKLTPDFPSKAVEARIYIEVLKKNPSQLRILYLVKPFFKNEAKVKTFIR